MRVAFLTPIEPLALSSFLPAASEENIAIPTGGYGGYPVLAIIEARLARGLKTDIVTCVDSLPVPIARWKGDILNLWVVRARRKHRLRDFYREETKLMIQALSESSAEVVHAHWTYEYGLTATIQKLLPAVVTVHDHSLRCLRLLGINFVTHFAMSLFVLRKTHVSSVVSSYIAPWVRFLSGNLPAVIPNIVTEKCCLLPSGVQTFACKRPHCIVCIGPFCRLKNQKNALEAFSILCNSYPHKSRLRLIGPGTEEGGIAEIWARRHNLHHNVDFCGVLPHHKVLHEVWNARVVFHPSLEESFGMVPIEGIMANCAVVLAEQAEGSASLLASMKGVFVVNGLSPAQMAQGLADALARTEGPEFDCSVTQKDILAKCEPNSILGKYESLYKQAVTRFAKTQ